jgi:hypothetical protein
MDEKEVKNRPRSAPAPEPSLNDQEQARQAKLGEICRIGR